MERHITARRFGAALLLAQLAVVTPARGAAASSTLTGVVHLPDDRTPAPAAVVDLSTAPGGVAFARGVTGYDGRFAVAIPASPDLVAAATANGDRLDVYATVSKLVPSDTGAVPALYQTVVTTVAYLVRTVDETGRLVAELVAPQPYLGDLVPEPSALANAIAVFQDPDLVTGNDDVNDPDLILPLGAIPQALAVSDANDPFDALGQSALADAGQAVDAAVRNAAGDGGAGDGMHSDCTPIQTSVIPAKGRPQPAEGLVMRVTTRVFHCENEDDRYNDYYGIGWDGWATDDDAGGVDYRLLRLKFRTELPESFTRTDESPQEDQSAGGEFQVPWSIGFPVAEGITGSVSGTFTVRRAKKIHVWFQSQTLFHVSWMSNMDEGSSGAVFANGGGVSFLVDDGTSEAAVLHALASDGAKPASNTIWIWKCEHTSGSTRCYQP